MLLKMFKCKVNQMPKSMIKLVLTSVIRMKGNVGLELGVSFLNSCWLITLYWAVKVKEPVLLNKVSSLFLRNLSFGF